MTACSKADESVNNQTEIEENTEEGNIPGPTVTPVAALDQVKTEMAEAEEIESMTYADSYKETGELPSLAKIYKDSFYVGVALSKFDLDNPDKAKLVASQFNSITCENEMKADFTLDMSATQANGDELKPIVNMKNAEPILTFAKENGIKMRGHTLVWHAQTPRWLFTVEYDNSPEAPLVTREIMLARMENYIKQEMEYVNNNYPGVIYAWDVVNEAIEPGDGQENGIRTKNNLWYEVIGEDYIEMAFTYARKYAATDQKLFYNDYGTYEKSKLFPIYNMISKLKEKGLIDGIGMQDHIQLSYPTILDYQYTINKYAELGINIQVTELDIDTEDDTDETGQKLATRYKNILSIINNCINKGKANITSVTLWGLSDDRSWLNNEEGPSFPLLFDKNLEPKSAYFGFLQDASIKSY